MNRKQNALLQCLCLSGLISVIFYLSPAYHEQHKIIKSSERSSLRRLFPFLTRDARYDELHHLLGGPDFGFKDDCEGGGSACRKGEQVFSSVSIDGFAIESGIRLESLCQQGIRPERVRTYEENRTEYWLHEGIHGRAYRMSSCSRPVLELAFDTTVLRFLNGNFESAYDGCRYNDLRCHWSGWTRFDSVGWEVLLKYESL